MCRYTCGCEQCICFTIAKVSAAERYVMLWVSRSKKHNSSTIVSVIPWPHSALKVHPPQLSLFDFQKLKLGDKVEFEYFVEAARVLGCAQAGELLDGALKKLAPARRPLKPRLPAHK